MLWLAESMHDLCVSTELQQLKERRSQQSKRGDLDPAAAGAGALSTSPDATNTMNPAGTGCADENGPSDDQGYAGRFRPYVYPCAR